VLGAVCRVGAGGALGAPARPPPACLPSAAPAAVQRRPATRLRAGGERARAGRAQGDGEVKRREDLRRRQTNPSSTLFVVNFDPERTRERDLERHFEPYGRLVRVQIKRNYGFVQYETIDMATDALKGTHLSRLDGARPGAARRARAARWGAGRA